MTQVSFDEISNKALTLPSGKRAELANRLIKSLEKKQDSDRVKAWDEEIEKRVREIRDGKAEGKPAESVLAEIRAQYS